MLKPNIQCGVLLFLKFAQLRHWRDRRRCCLGGAVASQPLGSRREPRGSGGTVKHLLDESKTKVYQTDPKLAPPMHPNGEVYCATPAALEAEFAYTLGVPFIERW